MPTWVRNELQVIGTFKELLEFREKLLEMRYEHHELDRMRFPDERPEEQLHFYDDALNSDLWRTEEPELYRYSYTFDTEGSPALGLASLFFEDKDRRARVRFFASETLYSGSVWMMLEDGVIRQRNEVFTRGDESKSQQERSERIMSEWSARKDHGLVDVNESIIALFVKESGGPFTPKYQDLNPFGIDDATEA
jgi:hypothetical protein